MSELPTREQLLEENRLLRIEVEQLRAKAAKAAAEPTRLPLKLTVRQFAALVQLSQETIRRRVKARQLEAHGPPYLIPRRELAKYGVALDDADARFAAMAAESA